VKIVVVVVVVVVVFFCRELAARVQLAPSEDNVSRGCRMLQDAGVMIAVAMFLASDTT
jgi:hypothetical protein